jgi:hypothetical protein
MISFRLSPEEYQHFRDFCLTQGTRSFSEMARAAVNKLAQDPEAANATNGAVESRLRNLEGRVQVLAAELRRLSNGDAASEPGVVSHAE